MQKKWFKWLIIFVCQLVVWKLILQSSAFIHFWFNYPYSLYNSAINLITSKIDVPLGEIFYTMIFLSLLIIAFKCVTSRSLNYSFQLIFKTLSILTFVYQGLWGFLYYKENFTLEEQHIQQKVLKEIYCEALKIALENRKQINSGIMPKPFQLTNDEVLSEFKDLQYQLVNEDWIGNYRFITHVNAKDSYASLLLSYFGVLGYYNPFTIESNLNSNNSDLKRSFTIHHELAHQMGFSSENEANFIAYFLGCKSKYKEVVYATNYKLMFSILNALQLTDPKFVLHELENLPIEIKNDRKAEINYYAQFEGRTNDAFTELNNQFLKANNQDGTISYSKYIDLVYYYKTKKANR